jgi:transcription factor C subunit 6
MVYHRVYQTIIFTQPFFIHKIYQLDYSRKSGEYRMLERFLPYVRPSMHAGSKPVKQSEKKKDPGTPTGTGAWPSEVGVHRVAWNAGNGLNAAPLLASGTASGLCRVDWLMGRWLREKIPYGRIVNLRGEVGADEGELTPDEDDGEED